MRCVLVTALSISAVTLASCSAPQPEPTGAPTAPQTIEQTQLPPSATPIPLPEYRDGASEIEPGSYAFLEYDTLETGSDSCGGALLDFPHYSYSGVLGGYGGGSTSVNIDKDQPIFGFMGVQLRLAGSGSGAYSYLTAIQELPLTTSGQSAGPFVTTPVPNPALTLHSLLADGTAIITIDDALRSLPPGEWWTHSSISEPEPGCQLTITVTIHNYGLLREDQLRIDFE
jgi:hypothetical protein